MSGLLVKTPRHEFADAGAWMPCCGGLQRNLEIGVWLNAVQLAGLDEGRNARPGSSTFVMAREQGVFAVQCQFPFIRPMSGQFIACSIGGPRILVPMLKSIDPIGVAMGCMWGLNKTRVLLSWLQPGFWML